MAFPQAMAFVMVLCARAAHVLEEKLDYDLEVNASHLHLTSRGEFKCCCKMAKCKRDADGQIANHDTYAKNTAAAAAGYGGVFRYEHVISGNTLCCKPVNVKSTCAKQWFTAYTVDADASQCRHGFASAVVDLASDIFRENFADTIIGDCDFGGQDPNLLCPRDMDNGCTMGQMFKGDPASCMGKIKSFLPAEPFKRIWGKSFTSIATMRQFEYKKGTQEGILAAGQEALKQARSKAMVEGQMYGIGVCTTLAAAGQTAIAEKMNADPHGKWAGSKIKFMREAYKHLNDGHEYLIITDENDRNGVLVDYWYSAMEGTTEGNVIPIADVVSGRGKWNLAETVVAKDKSIERVYVVQ